MIEYEVKTWGALGVDEQLKFYYDARHANECREGGETCLLGDASTEETAAAFETVLADFAPDFAWTLRPVLGTNSESAYLAIFLLPTELAPQGRLLPRDVAVSRLGGEYWSDGAAERGAGLPEYYECGICGCYHAAQWDGDCREDEARFAPDELDERHGPQGWVEVDQPDTGEPRHAKFLPPQHPE